MNRFMKPGWIYWGNCKECGKRFNTRNHTKAICPECSMKLFEAMMNNKEEKK